MNEGRNKKGELDYRKKEVDYRKEVEDGCAP